MTVPQDHFDALYAASADPWGFVDRWYEQRKYALTLAALPDERYGAAYEPGCSIGVLSEALALRCDRLLASDGSAAAVESARERLAGHRHVVVEQRRLPGEWPPGSYDLVLLSELLYFFSPADLDLVLGRAVDALLPGGALVAVHWRHPSSDHPLPTEEVHSRLAERATEGGLVLLARHAEEDFLLDVHTRPGRGEARGRSSVAARSGLV